MITHTHAAEEWDEYASDRDTRVTVEHREGTFCALTIGCPDGEVKIDDLDEAQELLTMLHQAIAAIHKRGTRK